MNTLNKTLLAVAAGTLMTAGAQAAVSYGNGMTAQPYIGAKVGQYDLDGAKDKGTSYGVYGGAKFTPNLGVEAEYLTTSDEDFGPGTEYSADVYGLYGTYDYAFPNTGGLYAKGRVGVAKNEVDVESKNSNLYKDSGSETGIAGGLGLGFNVAQNASIEAMYNWYPSIENTRGDDIDASGVTLGAHVKF
ncbi:MULTISPECIES: porin family protein [Psychrobacter]|jgi:opacity protein-like surface antigen|uniref:OmpA domain protein transmembrane region-containing protein n=1 Tax=Psychrobacter sp. (strain PRwf-1) TaxID=349106 RepID=A5WI18_PSYWF|nr:porin family protein [Psychrobacter sp. H7-1]